jgi:putative Mg2+ transporter-C (MgtC) family protein
MNFVLLSGHELLRLAIAIVVSYLLALPVGWERKRHSHAYVGLRVFPLVSVSACVYVFLGQQLFTGNNSTEQSDVLQGLMTGIGFIGAGAIIKRRGDVHGLATAAAVWTTGGIGAAVAYQYYPLAIALSLVNVIILDLSWRLAGRAQEDLEHDHKAAGKAGKADKG